MRYDARKYLSALTCASGEQRPPTLSLRLTVGALIAKGHVYFMVLAQVVTTPTWLRPAAEFGHGFSASRILALLKSFGMIVLSAALVARLRPCAWLAARLAIGR